MGEGQNACISSVFSKSINYNFGKWIFTEQNRLTDAVMLGFGYKRI